MSQKEFLIHQWRIPMLFFLITASYGWILRGYKVVDFLPFEYKDILQAHSHVTFLGWGFLGVTILIRRAFRMERLDKKPLFRWVFYGMIVMLCGLLISFPLEGYKLFSIVFLSLFLLFSYFYLYEMVKQLRSNGSLASRFIRTAIYLYYLSSVAIWLFPVVLLRYGKGVMYYDAIYFYLHFLYNGFFVFALFGILLRSSDPEGELAVSNAWKGFYWLTFTSCIPAYTLSMIWTDTLVFVHWIAMASAMVQMISLLFLWMVGRDTLSQTTSKASRCLLWIILTAYSLKIVFQYASTFPSIMDIAMGQKIYFVIGYLHLYTLGFMSFFLLYLSRRVLGFLLSRLGIVLLLAGVLLSEIMLFVQGGLYTWHLPVIPYFDNLLLAVSTLMPMGIGVILLGLKAFNLENQ